ncbi:response regulator transcription factor [Sphingobacterium spiritivorum]|uniref:Response regulator receiver domain protein n=1 Tax=Sphingobacterium spiritivorum ATCC 33861 TaxID=525373 RepID=D7VK59_SPHSI|nr:response regulator transcription factor [Sphingobacterium spiritivorum]EFK58661.1 response regulator receiver domain protein [Sphingobacterium spiritivorum ATCC 33861]QQT34440.1 response regulator transcription factor [Sphingobacterium spiritivorum]WQD35292.1 response regulator transcription factor [Sphingobacterium spiritivorum]SUI99897.1 Response regulator ArlR [Sphingobacterium spiritivorum]
MKILIVEDELELQRSVQEFLEAEQYVVEVASDYSSASSKINLYTYDCILLDINLPGGNGLTLLDELRGKEQQHTIIISARDSIDDKIRGLDLGADDYLTKPFHLSELNARIKAVLRRKQLAGNPVVQLNNLQINYDTRSICVNDQDLHFSRKEFDVFSFFVLNKNKLVTKTALAEHVWGDDSDMADNLDFIYSQIKNIRKKLKEHHAQLEIQAIYGIGYKMSV